MSNESPYKKKKPKIWECPDIHLPKNKYIAMDTTQNSKYWECQACTFNENTLRDNKCFVCFTSRTHNINTQSNTTKESVIHKQVSSQTTIKRNNNKPIMAKNKNIKRKSITKKPIKKANVKPKKKEKRKSGYKFGDITLGAVNMGANVTNKAVDGISGLTKTISKKTFGKLGW
eukprot:371404_1